MSKTNIRQIHKASCKCKCQHWADISASYSLSGLKLHTVRETKNSSAKQDQKWQQKGDWAIVHISSLFSLFWRTVIQCWCSTKGTHDEKYYTFSSFTVCCYISTKVTLKCHLAPAQKKIKILSSERKKQQHKTEKSKKKNFFFRISIKKVWKLLWIVTHYLTNMILIKTRQNELRENSSNESAALCTYMLQKQVVLLLLFSFCIFKSEEASPWFYNIPGPGVKYLHLRSTEAFTTSFLLMPWTA